MPSSHPSRRAGPVLRGAAVAVLAALAFLPIANWIPGGHDTDWYDTAIQLWLFGSLIVAGLAVVAALSAGRYGPVFEPLGRRLRAAPLPSGRVAALVLTAIAFAVYAFVATTVFSRRPLLISRRSCQGSTRHGCSH